MPSHFRRVVVAELELAGPDKIPLSFHLYASLHRAYVRFRMEVPLALIIGFVRSSLSQRPLHD
jgi:hypothetical protein